MTRAYALTKWSRIVRIRDNHTCYMCGRKPGDDGLQRRDMHAHHIRPKAKYPIIELELDNGICLCGRCHLSVVHNWEQGPDQFYDMFRNPMQRKSIKEFNERYQDRLG